MVGLSQTASTLDPSAPLADCPSPSWQTGSWKTNGEGELNWRANKLGHYTTEQKVEHKLWLRSSLGHRWLVCVCFLAFLQRPLREHFENLGDITWASRLVTVTGLIKLDVPLHSSIWRHQHATCSNNQPQWLLKRWENGTFAAFFEESFPFKSPLVCSALKTKNHLNARNHLVLKYHKQSCWKDFIFQQGSLYYLASYSFYL